MPKHFIHYKSCYFGTLYPVLEVDYILKDAQDFAKLQHDIVNGVAGYTGSNLQYEIKVDPNDKTCVHTRFKKSSSKSSLTGSEVKAISHALAGEGALSGDDRLLLENYINGTAVQPPAPPPPAPAPAASAPSTILPAGASHRGHAGGAPAPTAKPSSGSASGNPAGSSAPKPAGTTLSVPYLRCGPMFTSGMLYLNYDIAGATLTNQATRANVMQLNRAIQQATTELNQKLPAPGLHVTVAAPYPINSGLDCCVNIRFKNNPAHVMRALSLTEIFAIADELQAAGALQPADHAALIGNSHTIVGAQQSASAGNSRGTGGHAPGGNGGWSAGGKSIGGTSGGSQARGRS